MYIYIISHPKFEGWIKLGRAINPQKRLDSFQTNCPNRSFKLEYFKETEYYFNIETYFNNQIIGNGYEWYKIKVKDAINIINNILDELKVNPDYYCKGDNYKNSSYFKQNRYCRVKYNFIVDGKKFKGFPELSKYTNISSERLRKQFKDQYGYSFEIDGYEITYNKSV